MPAPSSSAGSALPGDWTTPIGPRNWPKPPHPRLIGRAITRPLKIRPEAVLGVTFPAGRVPTESWAGSLRAITGADVARRTRSGSARCA